MKIRVVASGSKGNCSIIYTEQTTIVIDIGISKKKLVNELTIINKKFDEIDAFLITHEHSDHIKNIECLPIEKIYSREKTYKILKKNKLKLFKEITIKDFIIQPLKTSHDAASPCGFLITDKLNGERLCYLTDTGFVPPRTISATINCEYYYIESNHDIELLETSNRPIYLKRRIACYKGHLSNVQCAEILFQVIGNKTKKIMLAHLSEECNREEIALETVRNYLINEGLIINNIEFTCAKQWSSSILC